LSPSPLVASLGLEPDRPIEGQAGTVEPGSGATEPDPESIPYPSGATDSNGASGDSPEDLRHHIEAGEPLAERNAFPEAPVAAVEARSVEGVRLAALDVLEQTLRITVRDGSDLPALRDCQGQARAMCEALRGCGASELPEDAFRLASGAHPFARLLTAVGGLEDLGDSEWAELHAAVLEAFGRPMAVAVARQRLALGPGSD
jgi:hypothetical protein